MEKHEKGENVYFGEVKNVNYQPRLGEELIFEGGPGQSLTGPQREAK